MKKLLGAAVLLSSLSPSLCRAQSPAAGDEAKQISVLKSSAATFEKAKACQRLAVIGTKQSIPVLSDLLADDGLAHYARFALEPIPDAAVDEVLRAAAEKLKGKLQVGAINSIGARRDVKAMDLLTRLLAGGDADAAAAAASALARIATPDAGRLLRGALTGQEPLRSAAADAALACADRLAAAGNRDEAVALYEALRRAEVAGYLRNAASRGAVIAQGTGGLALLAEMLESKDWETFGTALGVARELPGGDATRALVGALPQLPPEKKALLLVAIGDRRDTAALPAVLEAAREGSPDVRAGAVRALRNLGDASAVPVLLAAAGVEGALGQEALITLSSLRGKAVDASIAMQLDGADAKLRPALYDLVGRRRLSAAVPALKKAADSPDERTRHAALRALGQTVGLDDLSFLIERAVNPKNAADAAVAVEALQAAAKTMPDRDACASKLSAALSSATPEGKRRLLETFSSAGGAKAADAAAASARDPDEGVRDAAVNALADWRSEEAAPRLLALVKGTDDPKERLRALGGFSRFIRRLGFAKERRLGFCTDAGALCRTDDERKLVLEALAGVPAVETFPLLAPYQANAALREQACAAAVAIGERILRFQPAAVAEAMKKVLETTKDKDVAERARKLVEQAGKA